MFTPNHMSSRIGKINPRCGFVKGNTSDDILIIIPAVSSPLTKSSLRFFGGLPGLTMNTIIPIYHHSNGRKFACKVTAGFRIAHTEKDYSMTQGFSRHILTTLRSAPVFQFLLALPDLPGSMSPARIFSYY